MPANGEQRTFPSPNNVDKTTNVDNTTLFSNNKELGYLDPKNRYLENRARDLQ